jgi:hypothetical protein
LKASTTANDDVHPAKKRRSICEHYHASCLMRGNHPSMDLRMDEMLGF